ncbi:hypothetical protein [Thalassovita taeanensis]|uniref:Uncharacterized protein n=1 Tax=Thalassovita taeanensis TaxID=657014 RepID=A0A1H9JTB3_9RHOB|nr:hypothetical protein [Thalassovita taeanensis]SEQ90050.1 hypothetical protein SAMN04488092_11619 [Thalassovita taeanensis]
MRLAPLSLALIASLATALPAQAYIAENRLVVTPLSVPGSFEVISRPGTGPREFWCAAASYAQTQLGRPTTSRIFIESGLGPAQTEPGKSAVVYTVAPTPALAQGPRPGEGGNYFVSMRKPGFNLSVSHARSFCSDRDFDAGDSDWFP